MLGLSQIRQHAVLPLTLVTVCPYIAIHKTLTIFRSQSQTKSSFLYDDVKGLSKKDVDMGPFTAVDKLCSPSANLLSVNDRLNLVFQDSDIIPLFIQENYLHYRPYQARNELHRLELCAKAAALISEGDVMNKSVRARQVRNFPTHHTPPAIAHTRPAKGLFPLTVYSYTLRETDTFFFIVPELGLDALREHGVFCDAHQRVAGQP